ncbi:MAG: KOW motif-containing protein [Candidatus Woesearchaeota archaeon]
MISVGSVVMKIAGRDAGRIGVVLDVKDGRVLIDGQVRRREVSSAHVEPVNRTVEVSKGASTETVREALKAIGVEFPEPFANKRERVGGPKPVKKRASNKKPAQPAKTRKQAPAKSDAKDAPVKSPKKPKAKSSAKKTPKKSAKSSETSK